MVEERPHCVWDTEVIQSRSAVSRVVLTIKSRGANVNVMERCAPLNGAIFPSVTSLHSVEEFVSDMGRSWLRHVHVLRLLLPRRVLPWL